LGKGNGDYLAVLGFNNGFKSTVVWTDSPTIKEGYIETWFKEGAKLEDLGEWYQLPVVRYLNHFHNPLKGWSSAGLTDVSSGESLLLWAQDGTTQTSKLGGDWSWQKVRDYFYTALTANADTTRQEYFARTFRGVGHHMHLIQDTSVPAHVRNDSHAQDAIGLRQAGNLNLRLETWAKGNTSDVLRFANKFAASPGSYYPTVSLNVPISGKTPITQLVDADVYSGTNPTDSLAQGLSEYTNANFASEYTVFAENKPTSDKQYFPYPRTTSTDLPGYIAQTKLTETVLASDNIPDTSFWIKKTGDGETIDHFVRPGYFTDNLSPTDNSDLYKRTFYLDETCHSDYTDKLIPRAVGYSAALLDYFFRGSLEISPPDQQVYAVIDGSKPDQQFTTIKAKIKNTTSNETISSGTLVAVARYKVDANYSSDLSSQPTDNTAAAFTYSVSTPVPFSADINSAPVEFTFDFSNSKIPAGITDLTLQVVFQGTLGNEKNIAVAVGMKDVSEPTHHVIWNLTDMFSLDYQLHTALQIRNDADLALRAGTAQIDPFDITFTIGYGTDPNAEYFSPEVTKALLPNGRHMRLIGIFDNETPNVMEVRWSGLGNSSDNVSPISPFKNQVYGTTRLTAPDAKPFRESLNTYGVIKSSFMQHFSTGVLKCKPLSYDSGGKPFCAYPVEQAIPAIKAPFTATIQ
jgi:hypothetical protein